MFARYRTYNRSYINAIRPDTLRFGAQATQAAVQKRKSTIAARQAQQQAQQQATQQAQAARQQVQAAQQAAQAGQEPVTPGVRDPEALQRDVDQTQQAHLDINRLRAAQQQARQSDLAQIAGRLQPQPTPPDVADAAPGEPGVGPGSRASEQPEAPPWPDEPDMGPMPDFEGPDEAEVQAEPEGGESIDDLLGKLRKPDAPKESLDYFYSPRLGFVWRSPQAYIRRHQPGTFLAHDDYLGRSLAEAVVDSGLPLLAVVDVDTGTVLLDRALDHSQILQEAAWDYDHTIRLLPTPGGIRLLHDGLPAGLVRACLGRVPRVVYESLGC